MVRIWAVIAAMLLAGCVAPDAPETDLSPAPDAQQDGADISGGAFAVSLYDQLRAEPGNVLVSPVSILSAFGVVAEGARGGTQDAILSSLRLPVGPQRSSELGGMLRGLERDAEGATLRIANALWVQDGFAIRPEFSRAAEAAYGANAETVDFVGAPENAVARINGWVAERTNDRIRDLIARDAISANTRLVVTNAVWFLGDWAAPFNASNTSDLPFHLADGTTTPIPLMYQRGRYRYLETGQAQIVDLPYVDERMSMTVLLPRAQGQLDALETALPGALAGWLGQLDAAEPQTVLTYLPKLQMELSYDLIPALTVLGMGVAFRPGADLTGIADADLFIGHVVHKTFLRIDEKGTEAAAATGIAMEVTSAPITPPPTFRADHPFLFLIRDRDSGAVLFLGRVAEPEAPPAE